MCPCKILLQLALLSVCAVAGSLTASAEPLIDVDWPNYGNDSGRSRYSPLAQIDIGNVTELQVAWTYDTGDGAYGWNECTPIVVAGVMYVSSAAGKILALDAASGKRIWMFDPFGERYADRSKLPTGHGPVGYGRGVSYWVDEGGRGRVVVGTTDGRLILLDAKSGRLVTEFGRDGIVDLREGTGISFDRSYGMSSPAAIYENLAILGLMMRDTEKPAAPGDIRAFDLRNGKEVWRFHTIPHAGEFGADTWEGDSGRKSGGANPWGGVTIDEERGIAYAGLGAAVHDFYGGDRKGDNLFANSIVALDAQTGKRIWHYQLIHHDVWDYDLAAPPTLVNLQRDGRIIPAVVQTVKTGFVYVFDRVTGEPLFDIVEVPVPTDTDVPGEHLSPTQPIPVSPPPLSRQSFSPDELTNISSDAREFVLRTLKGLRYGTIFTPPSLGGTVSMPGYYGGLPWSGGSFDADTGVYYASSNNLPSIIKLEKLEEDGEISYRDYGYRLFSDRGVGVPLSELGIKSFPAGRPPWGSLSAVDISTGQILWQSTLGEYPELTQRGIPPTGTPNLGGNIVTGGGIVFIGATQDAMFRAFDKNTGEVLWKHPLATAAVATPSTYSVSGRQYVAINAGGGRFAPRSGDSFVAFTLPVRTK